MSVEKRREIKTKARSLAAESSAMAISSLRTFGELLTTEIGDKEGLSRASNESQQEFLERLHQVAKLPLQVRRDFEHLRVLGNKGIHEYVGTRQDFESAFKAACSLDEWWEMVILNHDSVSSARLEPQQPKRPNRTSTKAADMTQPKEFHWGNVTKPKFGERWPPSKGSLKTFIVRSGRLLWPDADTLIGPFSRIAEIGYVDTGPISIDLSILSDGLSADGVAVSTSGHVIIIAKKDQNSLNEIARYRDGGISLVYISLNRAISESVASLPFETIQANGTEIDVVLKANLERSEKELTPYDFKNFQSKFRATDPQVAEVAGESARLKVAGAHSVEARAEQERLRGMELLAQKHRAELLKMSKSSEREIKQIEIEISQLEKTSILSSELNRQKQVNALKIDYYKEILSITHDVENIIALSHPDKYLDYKTTLAKANGQLAIATGRLADLSNLVAGEREGVKQGLMRTALLNLVSTMNEIEEGVDKRQGNDGATPSNEPGISEDGSANVS